jgi:CRP/FNR family cyclic AMP-dependent transcriptional regulator
MPQSVIAAGARTRDRHRLAGVPDRDAVGMAITADIGRSQPLPAGSGAPRSDSPRTGIGDVGVDCPVGRGAPADCAEGVLRRSPLFDALDDKDVPLLRRQMAEVKLSRGEHLFNEGDDGDALYVVLEGKMKLTRAASHGKENLLSVIGPGEMLGELSLFDPRPRTSTASAVTDAVLASVKHEALTLWLRERPEISLHMLRALAQRFRRANDVMADLVLTDVPGRVAKNLLVLADRFGSEEADGLHVHHDLNQKELAQLVGSSRETVNKALAGFAARGWLQVSARSVLILDAERLRKRAR